MESPSTILEPFSREVQASLAEAVHLVGAGEELLSRAKVIAQRIHERCHQVVESDRLLQAYHNCLDGST